MRRLNVEPLSPRWHELRRTAITGSDVAALLGEHRWKTRYAVWARITEKVPVPPVDSEAMEAGRRLERAVAQWWSDETGLRLHRSPGLIAHDRLDYFLGTPDYLIPPQSTKSGGVTDGGVYEGKTTASWRQSEWEEGPPIEVIRQLESYLAITGMAWGSIAALIGGQRFRWKHHEPETGALARIEEEVERFWTEHVQPDTPPEPTGAEVDRELLSRLHPEEDGTAHVLSREGIENLHELFKVKAEIKAADALKTELENRIKNEMGDALTAVAPGVSATWKKETRHLKAREAREIETRVFRIKKDL